MREEHCSPHYSLMCSNIGMNSRRRPVNRDRLLATALHGTAWRRASEQGSIADAVEELRAMAGGRRDLLAEAAGTTAGSWSVRPAQHTGIELLVAGLLVAAGVDYDKLQQSVDLGRERAQQGAPDAR